MRGFESSTNPVFIKVDSPGLPATEVQVDGAAAEATTYGILATVGQTRYFVPWGHVLYVRQDQPPVGSPIPPTPQPVPPVTPVPPPPAPPRLA